MADEIPSRSRSKADAGNAYGERSGEQSPLQARSTFLKNWDWQLIDSLNRGACERGRAQYGHNSETQTRVKERWEKIRAQELSLQETFDFLQECHRGAPFLFFNGNTFSEVARRIIDAFLAEFPLSRRREAASLVAHYVAGVLDFASMSSGLDSLLEMPDFKIGDRVCTLKGSAHGVVKKIL
ncbi:MAG: hypothetical protein M3Y82_08430, partial [Verrucomicrobiota bacterium]|nr:hypothetical protein [Verrucomicrobiota bacterium]